MPNVELLERSSVHEPLRLPAFVLVLLLVNSKLPAVSDVDVRLRLGIGFKFTLNKRPVSTSPRLSVLPVVLMSLMVRTSPETEKTAWAETDAPVSLLMPL